MKKSDQCPETSETPLEMPVQTSPLMPVQSPWKLNSRTAKGTKITMAWIYMALDVIPSGMCPDLGEWWLHKGVVILQNLMIFNIYAQIVPA